MDSGVVEVGLVHGAALCALMSVIIGGSLRHDPRIWTHSGPPDVQAFLGPPPTATLRRKRAWGVGMAAILLGVFGSVARTVLALPGSTLLDVFAAAWVAFQAFNLFDALVIDLGLVLFRPRWAFVPGAENLPGLRSPRWHAFNYFKGFVGGFVFAGVVTGVAWLVGLA